MMNMVFLETLVSNYTSSETAFAAGLVAVFAAFFLFFFFLSLIIYVYLSFAYMHIGKKARVHAPGIAWIPGIGPLLIAFKASKMNAWPWWLLLSSLLAFIPFAGMFIYFIGMITFGIYAFIWHWKMFEAIGKPGWFAILMLIPIVNLIVLGFAAWSKK